MQKLEKSVFNDDEFIAMLAHDLKTPIRAQMSVIKLLCSNYINEFSDDVKNLIINLNASNKYLQCLLDNILNEYRINKKQFNLQIETHDIRQTIEEVLSDIRILSFVKEQKIEVNYSADNFIKNYDEIEIKRVLINLLSNAFDYSKENSTIIINVSLILSKLKIEIISQAQSLNLADNKRYSKVNFGLGLIICEKIINIHGGEFYKKINEDGNFVAVFILP